MDNPGKHNFSRAIPKGENLGGARRVKGGGALHHSACLAHYLDARRAAIKCSPRLQRAPTVVLKSEGGPGELAD